MAAIEIRNLTKSFGSLLALRDVDLAVTEGEFLTLVGPNGAGKTTLIRIVATLSRPTSGLTCRVTNAILATSSSTTALYTALTAVFPHVKGP